MQLKPITVIAVLLLVVASLLVSGCIVVNLPNSSSPTPTPTSIPTSTPSAIPTITTPTQSSTPSLSPSLSSGHNATLENMVAKYPPQSIPEWITTAYSVVWQGNNAVTISSKGHAVGVQNAPAPTDSTKTTLMIFPTTQDATNYLNAFDKSGYNFTTTDMSNAPTSVYFSLIPHNPSTFQYWQHQQLNGYSIVSESYIFQYDNFLHFSSMSQLT